MGSKQKPVKIGEVFGRLTVIAKAKKVPTDNYNRFICKCECGEERTVVGASLRCGNTKSCGCIGREKSKLNGYFSLKVPGEYAFNFIEVRYRRESKRRKISFNLTRQEFRSLIVQECYYCGELPRDFNPYYKKDGSRSKSGVSVKKEIADKQWVKFNGIDRKDSDKGYESLNCVPCCKKCNSAKMDQTEGEFLEYITKIFLFQQRLKAVA